MIGRASFMVAFILFSSAALGQSFSGRVQEIIDAKLDESHQKLREAIINLRDARAASCRFGSRQSCDQVKLSDVELILIDLETKYMQAARRGGSADAMDQLAKIRNLLGEARQNVSDLASRLDEAAEKGVIVR